MKVTNIEIKKINTSSRLKAMVNVTFDDSFVIHDIKIIESNKDNNLFIAMPSKKLSNGKYVDTAHPITQQMRETLTVKILEEYNK